MSQPSCRSDLQKMSPTPRRGRPRADEADLLRRQIIWNAWLQAEGGSEHLRDRYVMGRYPGSDILCMREDEFAAYARGRRSQSRLRLQALVEEHPAIGHLLTWPVAALSIRERPLAVVDRWRLQYFDKEIGPRGAYRFPSDPTTCAANRRPLWPEDLDGLYERGDPYGFLVLVSLLWRHHIVGDTYSLRATARYVVKALPGMCRDISVRPSSPLVIRMTKRLLATLYPYIELDEAVVLSQITDPLYEPCYCVRAAAAKAGRVLPEPKDPLVTYKLSTYFSPPF